MKVKFSALVSDMRGKLNGSVMSRNRGGSYLRNKTTPLNPQTTEQQVVRSLFGNISSQWRSITQEQMEEWRRFADAFPYVDIFGDERRLTGSQMFQRVNINLALSRDGFLASPEYPLAFPIFEDDTTLVVARVAGEFRIALSNLPVLPDDMSLAVFATPGVSAGRTFAKSQMRLIDYYAVPPSNEVEFTEGYVERFGEASVGTKVFVRIAIIDLTAGVLSVPLALDSIVVE